MWVSIPPTEPAFLCLPSSSQLRGGICKQGIRHRNAGAVMLLARIRGAGGIQELLRDESQIRAHFLAVFAGSCGCAAIHQGGVRIPETSPSSELDDFEMENLVFIKFSKTGP